MASLKRVTGVSEGSVTAIVFLTGPFGALSGDPWLEKNDHLTPWLLIHRLPDNLWSGKKGEALSNRDNGDYLSQSDPFSLEFEIEILNLSTERKRW